MTDRRFIEESFPVKEVGEALAPFDEGRKLGQSCGVDLALEETIKPRWRAYIVAEVV
jgi:hypothetical protein